MSEMLVFKMTCLDRSNTYPITINPAHIMWWRVDKYGCHLYLTDGSTITTQEEPDNLVLDA